MLLARFVVSPDPLTFSLRLQQGGWIVLTGSVALILAHIPWLQRFCREIGILGGLVVAVVLIWFSLRMMPYDVSAGDFILG